MWGNFMDKRLCVHVFQLKASYFFSLSWDRIWIDEDNDNNDNGAASFVETKKEKTEAEEREEQQKRRRRFNSH